MVYQRSAPLTRWLQLRRETIDRVAEGHARVGDLTGPGRPLDASKPLAHAYILVLVSQFQGFVRDLHDLAIARLLDASKADDAFIPVLTEGLVRGRGLDRGNPNHSNIKRDFHSLGLDPFDMGANNVRWSQGDSVRFDSLMTLRNALAHGNEGDLRDLLQRDIGDTVSWGRSQLPVLNRYAKTLDKLVWDHLHQLTGKEPW